MSFLLNILWIVFGGGIVIAAEYAVVGFALCLTIVGIPAGVQCWKIAAFSFLPFGTTFVPSPSAGAISFGLNLLWLICAGLWIFLSHIALGAALCVSIVGIPFGVQHFKLALLALAPFGKELVDV